MSKQIEVKKFQLDPHPHNILSRIELLEREVILRGKTEFRLLATLREKNGPYRWMPYANKGKNCYEFHGFTVYNKTHNRLDGIEKTVNYIKANQDVFKSYSEYIRELGKFYQNILTSAPHPPHTNEQTFNAINKLASDLKELAFDGQPSSFIPPEFVNIANNLIACTKPDYNKNLYANFTHNGSPYQYKAIHFYFISIYAMLNSIDVNEAVRRLMELEHISDNILSYDNLFTRNSWYQTFYYIENIDFPPWIPNNTLIYDPYKISNSEKPHENTYTFYNLNGSTTGRVKELIYNDGYIQLPVTYWKRQGDERVFEMHVPFGKDTPLYNLHLAYQCPDKKLYLTRSLKHAKTKCPDYGQIEEIWLSWPSFAGEDVVANVDFSPIYEKDVTYVISDVEGKGADYEYRKALDAYKKLKHINKLRFIDCFDGEILGRKSFQNKVHKRVVSPGRGNKTKKYLLRSAINKGEVKPIKHLLHPIIQEGGITLLYSGFGIGKTWAALSIAYAVSQGVNVCEKLTVEKAFKVLYIDSEMGANAMISRLEYMEKIYPNDKACKDNLFWYSVDPEDSIAGINLENNEDCRILEEMIEDANSEGTTAPVSLLVLDNLSTLTSGTNSHSSWMKLFKWLYKIKSRGCSILALHHENKKGDYLGSVLKGITVDSKVHLTEVETPSNGIEFNVIIEKSRHLYGNSVLPFTMGINLNDEFPRWDVPVTKGNDIKEEFDSLSDKDRSAYLKKQFKYLRKWNKVADELGITTQALYMIRKRLKMPVRPRKISK